MRLRIRHASCGIRFQCISISCVNAHVSVHKDTFPIHLWILIFAVSVQAYAYVHMDSQLKVAFPFVRIFYPTDFVRMYLDVRIQCRTENLFP